MTVRRLLAWVADSSAAVLPLSALAVAERVAWTLAGHMENRDTELRNAAIAWAQSGAIGDAFRAGSGPTAHVGALPLVIPGAVFRLFGIDTPASVLVLTAISALVVVTTALVLSRLFARLGMPAVARGAAVLLICILPLHLELEARSLRVYENGVAALMLALLLLAVMRLDMRGRVGALDVIGLSALAAAMLGLSPIVGGTAVAILVILALRRMHWPGRFAALATLATVLAATTLPWALRNRAVLGEALATRSNSGLEFAIGTHPAAVAPTEPAQAYLSRLAEIHPHGSDPAYRAMRVAGGELPYARALGSETWSWVAANPAEASRIWLRHWFEFFFPPPWLWHHVAPPDATLPLRVLLVDLIAVFALGGLVRALHRRRWELLYFLPPVVLLPLPYLVTQPLIRYRYVIASLLIFLAADCVARMCGREGKMVQRTG